MICTRATQIPCSSLLQSILHFVGDLYNILALNDFGKADWGVIHCRWLALSRVSQSLRQPSVPALVVPSSCGTP